jgi:hypothetical protein
LGWSFGYLPLIGKIIATRLNYSLKNLNTLIYSYLKELPTYNVLDVDFRSHFEYISESEIKSTIDFNVLREMYVKGNFKAITILPYHEPLKKKINFDFIKYFDDLRSIYLRFGFYQFDLESFRNNFPDTLEVIHFNQVDQYNFDIKDFNAMDYSFVDGHPNLRNLGFESQSKRSTLILEHKMPKILELFLYSYREKNIKIDIANYPNLRIFSTDLPQALSYFDFSHLNNLKFLRLKSKIQNLNTEEEIKNLPPSLEVLELNGFQNTKVFPDLSHLINLRYLAIDDFKGLEDVSALSQLKNLEFFSFHLRNKDFDLEKLKALHKVQTLKYIGGIRGSKIEDFDVIQSMFQERFNKSRMDYIINLNGVGEFYDRDPTGLSYIDGFY